ncbi:pentatricopeptide repeat-containing protein At2g35030, mitochondrial [Andrographis paniculata]|uniref:pentatricopeptide repeat-containing protein At2g35030, mitochondrial n=1 Tax=Andrographis paniculata TaxID=175694 RepID=UPI0021E8DD2A|nr:pentatricopeptide repeat-containing protein At2g35030, mitochondrial [Andrographis paniculata]
MLNSSKASRTLINALSFITETAPLCVMCFSELHDHHHPPSKQLFHSNSLAKRNSEFSIPKEDHSSNKDVVRANWKVTKLCQEGRISEAHKLFDEMPERDVITWTALISGYINLDMLKEGRNLFDRSDALKNVVTWTVLISGYLKSNRIFEAEKLFDEMPVKNVVAWNTMIEGYAKIGRIEEALALFDAMEDRNVVSWNIAMTGLIDSGRIEDARWFFDRMPTRDVVSWNIMLSGLARNGRIDEARFVFERMPDRNVVAWNAMVTGYARNARLREAYSLFEAIPDKNVMSWNAMITGFIQNGEIEEARRLFRDMPRKNIVSWTTMITGCLRHGATEEALNVFVSMGRDGRVRPNDATFVSVLGACSELAFLRGGAQIHQMIIKSNYRENERVTSALMNMYSKCGELATVKKMFDDNGLRRNTDLVVWNTMIAAYAHHGRGEDAISIFGKMRRMGFNPDAVSYKELLSACSHAGLVEEGLNYFNALINDESVELKDDHYTCVVDLYSRAGRLKEAFDLLERSELDASAHAWGALLSGCNVHSDAEVRKLAVKKLMKVKMESSGAFANLSNMYARDGKWGEAEGVRSRMYDRGLKKQPGCSWIDVGNKFHVFFVGDGLNSEIDNVRSLLLDLHEEMKIGFLLFFDVSEEVRFECI